MKYSIVFGLLVVLLMPPCLAQERIYRCGNEYTNTLPDPKNKGCKLVEGGNVTVVQGTRPAPAQAVRAASGVRVESPEQKSRDSDARQILESELQKAQARQAELAREYNNGEPEKRGDEVRNHQRYLERVNELKAALARNESDIAGIRREIARVNAAAVPR